MSYYNVPLCITSPTVPEGYKQIPSFPLYAINENGDLITLTRLISRWKSVDYTDRLIYAKAGGLDPNNFRSFYTYGETIDRPVHAKAQNSTGYIQHAVILDATHPDWSDARGRSRKSVNERRRLAHRLVYETFIGPIPPALVIDHIDGNPQNNHVSNLRAVTQRENINNPSTKHNNPNTILTLSDARDIRALHKSKSPDLTFKAWKKNMSELYSVSASNIEAIVYNKSWKE